MLLSAFWYLCQFLSLRRVAETQKHLSIVLLHSGMKLLCCCSFFNIFFYLQSGPVCFNCLMLNASKCVSVDSPIGRHGIFYNKRVSKNVFHRNSILLLFAHLPKLEVCQSLQLQSELLLIKLFWTCSKWRTRLSLNQLSVFYFSCWGLKHGHQWRAARFCAEVMQIIAIWDLCCCCVSRCTLSQHGFSVMLVMNTSMLVSLSWQFCCCVSYMVYSL
jgi:hypothetical protein